MKKAVLKTTRLIIATMTLTAVQAQNQTFDWAKRMGDSDTDEGSGITTDKIGNTYTTGIFSGKVDFDPDPAKTFYLTSSGVDDLFISKLDVSGNFLWAKQMGGVGYDDYATSIATDAAGNVYTTGYFVGTADFNPDPSIAFNLTSAGNNLDIFLSKLDTDGHFLWAKRIGGVNADNGSSLATDATGNVFMAGSFYGTVDFDPSPTSTYNLSSVRFSDGFVSKFDASGNFLWGQSMGGLGIDPAASISTDAAGNVFTTGHFSGTAKFNTDPDTPIQLTSFGMDDAFVSKHDGNGNLLWVKQIGGASTDRGNSVKTDTSGNVYVAGRFEYTADFNPDPSTTFELTPVGAVDIFISKLDANGNFLWAKSMGGFGNEYLVEITTDQAGNVYSTGHFDGTADFDPALGTFELTSPANNWDIFISMLDKNGNFIGARRMGGTSGDYGKSIATDTKGNIYTTGYFSGTADFNPNLPKTFNFISLGSSDVFISKLRPCSLGDSGGDCVLSNIEDGQTTTKPLFYPNPALDILHINLEAVSDVRILDFTGKILLAEHLKSNKLDISRIKPGIYLLELNSTNTTRTVKLTVE